MKQIEQTLASIEVAEMVGKEHKNLLRDVSRYINQLNELNIEPVDFFKESTYFDGKGESRPCYQITRKGCEFIAHKLTGTKGTEFTAKYINRFHEMEDTISAGQLQNQTEYLAKAVLEASRMLEEKDKKIRALEQRATNTGAHSYREYIINFVNQIQSEKRLCQIYTIAKKLCKFEKEIKSQ